MSTVGVDIGDWVFEKKIRGQSSYGPVVFRYCPNTSFLKWSLNWDFLAESLYIQNCCFTESNRRIEGITC
jgi:hypothetical protein